jgi:hypothetical protein
MANPKLEAKIGKEDFVQKASKVLKEGKKVDFILKGVLDGSKLQKDIREQYLFLHRHVNAIKEAVKICVITSEEKLALKPEGDTERLKEERADFETVDQLSKSMLSLDDDCGNDANLNPHMNQEEHDAALKILDADKEVFASILKRELKVNFGIAQLILIDYARLLYRFNAYQADFRTDPVQAALDAAGLSDNFQELLEQIQSGIKKESEPEKKAALPAEPEKQ